MSVFIVSFDLFWDIQLSRWEYGTFQSGVPIVVYDSESEYSVPEKALI